MMQNAHIQRGWGDIGQHFTVFQSGRVYEGRELSYQGVHAAGANSYTIGIEHQGDFRYCRPTAEQTQASAELIAHLFSRLGWGQGDLYRIKPHRFFSQTACPVCIECVDHVRDVVGAILLEGGRDSMAASKQTVRLEPGQGWRTQIYKGNAYSQTYDAWVHAIRADDNLATAVHLREIGEDGKTRWAGWVLDRSRFFGSRRIESQGNVVVDLWIPPDQAPAFVVVEQVTY